MTSQQINGRTYQWFGLDISQITHYYYENIVSKVHVRLSFHCTNHFPVIELDWNTCLFYTFSSLTPNSSDVRLTLWNISDTFAPNGFWIFYNTLRNNINIGCMCVCVLSATWSVCALTISLSVHLFRIIKYWLNMESILTASDNLSPCYWQCQ